MHCWPIMDCLMLKIYLWEKLKRKYLLDMLICFLVRFFSFALYCWQFFLLARSLLLFRLMPIPNKLLFDLRIISNEDYCDSLCRLEMCLKRFIFSLHSITLSNANKNYEKSMWSVGNKSIYEHNILLELYASPTVHVVAIILWVLLWGKQIFRVISENIFYRNSINSVNNELSLHHV